MSPAKSLDPSSSILVTTKKRKPDASPAKFTNGTGMDLKDGARPIKVMKKGHGVHESPKKQSDKKPGFTFEEVKGLLDNILSKDKKLLDSSVNVGIKNIDYSDCLVPGHQEEECKQLVDKLVHNTRRIRTLEEVLNEIKTSLSKRTYTDIIKYVEKPKRPPSAYLMYHQKRFKELQEEGETLAAEVAKKVAEEWKTLSDYERSKYLRQHEKELKVYEESIEKLGYTKVKKPVRPKSAKMMYVKSKMAERGNKLPKDKSKLDKLKKNLEDEFDKASFDIKEHWNSMHDAETKLYEQAKAKFVEDNPHLDPTDILKSRPCKVKITPPDGPRNALKFYLEKKLPEEGLEGAELKEKEAKLREKFERLSDKKLLKYIKKALRDKDRYETELKEFVEQHPYHKVPTHKPNITKKEWQLYQKLAEGRPAQPAPTPYLHFCQSHIKNDGLDQAPTQRLQEASKAWKNLTTREIATVQDEHLNYIKKYIEDMEAWLAEQDRERIDQLFQEDPKSKPDYWRKRIPKVQKSNAKSLVQGIKVQK